jgi:hypothetical protein
LYRLNWESGLTGTLVTYSGRVSAGDIASVHEEITADPSWNDLQYVIVDASAIDGVDVDTSSRAALAEPNILLIGAAVTREPLLFAVVTHNLEMLHLLRRQRELLVFPYPTPVFGSVAAARRWVVNTLGR